MISAAMALYNGERFLKDQILSMQNQTLRLDELVICNDASTDGSLEVIEQLRPKLSFDLVVLNNEKNMGLTFTLSRAFEAARGDYIFYTDQDDVWFNQKLEAVVYEFERNKRIQVITHNAVITDENLKPLGACLFDYAALNKMGYATAAHGFATAIRRDFIKYGLPIAQGYSPDRFLSLLGTAFNVKLTLDKPLTFWRRHEKAATFESCGESSGFWHEVLVKLKSNALNFGRTRTTQWFNNRRSRETAVISFCEKIYALEKLPAWCESNLLNAFYKKALRAEAAYKMRSRVLEKVGFERFKAVLSAYKRGAYKPFHSFQTAIDDLLRSAK